MSAFWVWVFACSVIGVLLMGYDKRQAEQKKWRVPERVLFLWAALGGSLGILLGMYLFRHKTLHKSFTWGVPAIILLQVLVVVAILRWGLVMEWIGAITW